MKTNRRAASPRLRSALCFATAGWAAPGEAPLAPAAQPSRDHGSLVRRYRGPAGEAAEAEGIGRYPQAPFRLPRDSLASAAAAQMARSDARGCRDRAGCPAGHQAARAPLGAGFRAPPEQLAASQRVVVPVMRPDRSASTKAGRSCWRRSICPAIASGRRRSSRRCRRRSGPRCQRRRAPAPRSIRDRSGWPRR